MPREQMEFDVIIVGAGPAGLSAAIKLAQLAAEKQKPLNICILEKGAEVGAQILSGAVLEPRALNQLIPNWRELGAPIHTPATEDHFLFLTETKSYRLPTPPQMKNEGNYIISLGLLCRWLANHAEALGIQIFPGFAATEVLYQDGKVVGVATGPKGVDKEGQPSSCFQEGIELRAKQTFFAEGVRGYLSQQLMDHYQLRKEADPQTYGLGIKEIWEVPAEVYQEGKVIHSVGWPLDFKTYGGSFLYHFDQNKVAVGYVIGLDYENPYFNPYQEFQRFKTHPAIAPIFENSKRLAYGAKALNEGGFQSIPKLSFPGGLLIGCAVGFLNVAKIKGIHTSMKSGMIAAEAVFSLLDQEGGQECLAYQEKIKHSWIWDELYHVRNIRPAFRAGLLPGLAYAAFDTYLLQGNAPWTFHHKADHSSLKKAIDCPKINYPKPDGWVSFDLMSSVYLANITHPEDQPCHLKLKNPALAIEINYDLYDSPETRYCPAGVYEILNKDTEPYLQINSANCLHCKACDIKDPMQNIVWTPPEGGSGPQYEMM